MLDELLVGLFGGLFGAWMTGRIESRRAARLRKQGQLDCALRDLSRTQPHLSVDWRRGVASLEDGRIVMDQVDLHVATVDLANERSPQGKEIWSIHPFTRILVAGNEDGTFEIAVQEYDVPWVLDRFGQPDLPRS